MKTILKQIKKLFINDKFLKTMITCYYIDNNFYRINNIK